MTAPLFYTIAQPHKDQPPILVEVYRVRGHHLHGIRATGATGLIAVRRTLCTGSFHTFAQAQAAYAMATAVFEQHQLRIERARTALDRAHRGLVADMHRRITAMLGASSLR